MADKGKKETVPAPRVSDPFQALQDQMDRMFDSFFGGREFLPRRLEGAFPGLSRESEGMVVPSVDIKETDKSLTLTAELPGIDEKDVELSVRNGMLTLKGEKKYEHEEEKEDVHMLERSYGSFQRSFRLPDTVDTDRIEARFDKGVLKVAMPKKAEAAAAAKKIAIGGR
jgi:HSP20 family protein